MSDHPDYTQFRREMFAGMGLPVNSHQTHDWRKMPTSPYSYTILYIMQSISEVKQLVDMGYPFTQTVFTVPNWSWCPRWLWSFIPNHLEVWTHKRPDILAEERVLKEHRREQEDKAMAEYRQQLDDHKCAAKKFVKDSWAEYEKRKERSDSFWDTIDA